MSDIVVLKTVVIIYKAYNNSLPINIQKLFTLHDSVYMTRQCLKTMCTHQAKKYENIGLRCKTMEFT